MLTVFPLPAFTTTLTAIAQTPSPAPPIGAAPAPPTLAATTSKDDRLTLLRFAASFLWADHRVDGAERGFFFELARELGLDGEARVDVLLDEPPHPDDVDPSAISAPLAVHVRDVALRAIAADGFVDGDEMEMFFLLDELLADERRTVTVQAQGDAKSDEGDDIRERDESEEARPLDVFDADFAGRLETFDPASFVERVFYEDGPDADPQERFDEQRGAGEDDFSGAARLRSLGTV